VAAAFNGMAAELEESFNRQQELEQARRDLIAAVSHDLRTPLASVRAMVEALADEVVTDQETINRYHQTIQNQVSNLALLIDDLFELSKIDSGRLQLKLEGGCISDIISDTLESMRAQALAKQVRLTGQVDPNTPNLTMDSAKIQRVIYNLVQNAIRHTPSDGSVFIAAATVDEGIKVDVRDTGEGIAGEDLPRIFEHFYRGEKSRSRSTGGAGLGLAIAKGIVEAHGGRIWVDSKVGEGTIFSFILPQSTPA
jgi:signal transduction histidine kinase